jgi:hypothetical protein
MSDVSTHDYISHYDADPLLAEFVESYRSGGWHVLSLPQGAKYPPPHGYTGAHAAIATDTDITQWFVTGHWAGGAAGNLGLHMPSTVIGIDVDAYGDKPGLDTLAALSDDLGPLPATWSSSSRTDGSSISFYRVPDGKRWLAGMPGIEIIQSSHRYAVVAPSLHPEGRVYGWTNPAGVAVEGFTVPAVADLPLLPETWVSHLVEGEAHTVERLTAATTAEIDAWRELSGTYGDDGELQRRVIDPANSKIKSGSSRHDAMLAAVRGAVRDVAAHRYPAVTAEATLRDWWERLVSIDFDDGIVRTPAVAAAEFDSALSWSVTNIGYVAIDRSCSTFQPMSTLSGTSTPETGSEALQGILGASESILEPQATLPPNLAAEFWAKRPELLRIRQFAESTGLSPDALLGAVLARVAVATPPNVVLPDLVGATYGSLNCIHALIGASGSGKSTTMGSAAVLLPLDEFQIDRDGIGIGTGEGIIEAYLDDVPVIDEAGKTRSEKAQTRTRILFSVDEGQIMSDMSKRNGSTLMSILRSAWSGATLGQSNAQKSTSRELKAHLYRFAALVGFQPSKAEAILEDEAGGTPQRLLWFSVTDPNMLLPEDRPERPAAFHWQSRPVQYHRPEPTGKLLDISHATNPVNGPAEAIIEVLQASPLAIHETGMAHTMAGRGESDINPLDSHKMLLRGQTAALLALLADPLTDGYSDDDWLLAGEIVDTSCGVRDWVLTSAAEQRRRDAAARNMAAAGQAVTVRQVLDDDATTRAARSIGRKVARSTEPVSEADCWRGVSSKVRKQVTRDDVLALAVDLGLIEQRADGTYQQPAQ